MIDFSSRFISYHIQARMGE